MLGADAWHCKVGHKWLRRLECGRLCRATSAAKGQQWRNRRFCPCLTLDPGNISLTSSESNTAGSQISTALLFPFFSSREGSLPSVFPIVLMITHTMNPVFSCPWSSCSTLRELYSSIPSRQILPDGLTLPLFPCSILNVVFYDSKYLSCLIWLRHCKENKMFLGISKSLSPKLILLPTGLLPARPSQKFRKLFCLFSQPSLPDLWACFIWVLSSECFYYWGICRNILCCISARLVILSEESQFDCMNWLSWTGQPSKVSRLLVNVFLILFWLSQKPWTQWLTEKEEANPTLWRPFQLVDCLEIS